EASMIDLPLMSKLLDAIPESGRLILLGDRYQLASVESGSVLADLCTPAGVNAFSDVQRAAAGPLLSNTANVTAPSPLADHVVTLQTSHRFTADSAIGRLAAAINAGDADAVQTTLTDEHDEVRTIFDTGETSIQGLVDELATAYAGLHTNDDPQTGLATIERTRLLTVTRIGPLGSETMNRRVATRLARDHGFDPDVHWYHGRPIMIVQNDSRAGLYNGDVGVIRQDDAGHTRAWFRAEDSVRSFHPSLLPAHETAYAMTVHKSQGSEFESVYLLLPQAQSPLLTRELLYTAVTRPRRWLRVYGGIDAWQTGIAHSTTRFSGLSERLAM
ncbi:MAG: exodeoxyribonuclease V subunit alpha, partial [Halofilum sp. (in: g-proteobacteria)]